MKSRTVLLPFVAILLAALAATMGFAGWSSTADEPPPLVAPVSAYLAANTEANTPSAADTSDAKVVLLALRPEGFEPKEMQLSAGEYLLIVRNRSGLDEFNVRLLRENGENLREASVRGHRKDWKHLLKLTPDTYLLTETNHPNWACRITVKP